jgi:protein subunit release factor A
MENIQIDVVQAGDYSMRITHIPTQISVSGQDKFYLRLKQRLLAELADKIPKNIEVFYGR